MSLRKREAGTQAHTGSASQRRWRVEGHNYKPGNTQDGQPLPELGGRRGTASPSEPQEGTSPADNTLISDLGPLELSEEKFLLFRATKFPPETNRARGRADEVGAVQWHPLPRLIPTAWKSPLAGPAGGPTARNPLRRMTGSVCCPGTSRNHPDPL